MKRDDRHWTEDTEALEDYVLDRVDPKKRIEYGNHLKECPDCRLRVEEEMALAAGTRLHGREAVREQLKAQLAAQAQVPWPKILSIAAVVVLAVGIGVYNRWLFEGPEPMQDPTDRVTSMLPEQQKADTFAAGNNNEMTADISENQPADRDEPGDVGALDTGGEIRKRKDTPGSTADDRNEEGRAMAAGGEDAGSRDADLVAAGEKSHAREPEPRQSKIIEEEGIRLNAYLIDHPALTDARAESPLARTEDIRESVRGQEEAPREPAAGFAEIRDAKESLVVFLQKESETGKQDSSVIRTLVRDTDDSTFITLFLPPELSDIRAEEVTAEFVTSDSVIITVGQARIGLHLPPGRDSRE